VIIFHKSGEFDDNNQHIGEALISKNHSK